MTTPTRAGELLEQLIPGRPKLSLETIKRRIADWGTNVNGLSAEDLPEVVTTLEQLQALAKLRNKAAAGKHLMHSGPEDLHFLSSQERELIQLLHQWAAAQKGAATLKKMDYCLDTPQSQMAAYRKMINMGRFSRALSLLR